MSWDHDSITSKRTVKNNQAGEWQRTGPFCKNINKKPLILDVILGKKKYTRGAVC
jgi:hypothetical protein